MSQINIKNLSFYYEGSHDYIFKNVSFNIDTDWKLGFVGRNGRGKTTFLNLMLRKYEYEGKISSVTEFDYFPLDIRGNNIFTIYIAEDIIPKLEYWQIKKELTLLGVDEDVLYRPFNTLSLGEQSKVMLAILFLKENKFLLIDEPTNHLDSTARDIIADYLNSKKGFILVSHDRELLDKCTDHTLSIGKENIEIQKGNFSSWYNNKTMQDEFEKSENEKLKKEIDTLNKAKEKTSKWSDKVESSKKGEGAKVAGLRPDRGHIGAMAAKMMRRSKSIEKRADKAIDKKSKLLKNIESAEPIIMKTLTPPLTNLYWLKDVSLSYGNKEIIKNVSIDINKGDRVSISGKNGSGKSTLMAFLLKNLSEDILPKGEYRLPENLTVSYIPQKTSDLNGTLDEYITKYSVDETVFKSMLRKLDFDRKYFSIPTEEYSEGQKKKVHIARSLSERAHVYIWDEPLNYVDIFSKMQIEDVIMAEQPTMIFVEHDKTFTKKIANKYINL